MKFQKCFLVVCIACLVTTAAIVMLLKSQTNYAVKADSGGTKSSRANSSGTDSSSAGSINSSGTDSTSIINPGCRERALKAYRPVKTARHYHHPPIVHYAKFHKEQDGSLSLTLIEYLSMLSAYKVLQPKIIFLHSNGRFVGKYWNITQTWTNTTVRVNIIEKLAHFGNCEDRIYWTQCRLR